LRELFWRGGLLGGESAQQVGCGMRNNWPEGPERRERRVWDGSRTRNSEGGFACRGRNPGKDNRRAEAGLSCCASRTGEGVRRLCGRRQRGAGGFLDEAGEVEENGKGISDEKWALAELFISEVRGAFKAEAGLGGIAGFGVGLSADAEMPEIRIDLDIARARRMEPSGRVRPTERDSRR